MEDKMEEVKFYDLAKEIGFALAAKLANALMGDEFWNNITFDDCFSIIYSWRDRWEATPATSITMKTALLKASKKAETLDNWLMIYYNAEDFRETLRLKYHDVEEELKELKELKKLSLEKLAQKAKSVVAKTFDEYQQLYEKLRRKGLPYASEPMQIITRKMAKKAENFQQYYQVYEGLSDDSKLKETILNKMVNKAKNFREWYEVYTVAPPGSKLKEIAFYNLKEKSEELKKFERWYEIYCDEPELKELALKRMFETANTFNDWFKVYTLAPYGSNERVAAFNKLLEKPQSFNDWRDFYDRFAEIRDKVMMKIAAQKMSEYAQDFKEWLVVFNCTPRGSELEETALHKLAEKAKTLFEWLKLYHISPSDSPIKEMAFRKINNDEESCLEDWYIIAAPVYVYIWTTKFIQIGEFYFSDINKEIRQIALNKMKSRPIDEWIRFYEEEFRDSAEFHKMAEEELRRRIKITFD